jgi:hypothetical protein
VSEWFILDLLHVAFDLDPRAAGRIEEHVVEGGCAAVAAPAGELVLQ